MTNAKLTKKNFQRKQYKKNKEENEQLTKSFNEKEQTKHENSLKRKKILKKGFLIGLCVLLSIAIILPLSIYFASKLGQKNKLFMNELAAVQNDNGKWGYVNSVGNKMIDYNFEYAFPFTKNKLALVKYNGKYGFIDRDSHFVIKPIYDEAISFDDGIAICLKDGVYGGINKKGEEVIEFKYSNIVPFENDYAIAVLNGNYGIINRNGETVVDFKYEVIDQVNEKYFRYLKNQKHHIEFIDSTKNFNELFNESEYDFQDFDLISNGFVIYRQAGLYGLINGSGKVVFENKYAKLSYNKGDYLIYSSGGDYYGYVDFKGNIIIEDEYESASNFVDGVGVLKVKNENKYEVLDKNGSVKFTLECDKLEAFSNGKAVFKKDSLFGVVDKNGKLIIEAKYNYISDYFDDGYAIFISENNKYGIVNSKGKVVVDAIFKNIVG